MHYMSKKKAIYIWSSESGTRKSTSAGVFYLVAYEFMKRNKDNAAVYGCAFDEKLVARHIRITDGADLSKLQGSKYVQSNTEGIYKLVKKDIKDGKMVLFSGTACQTLAVKNFIGSACEHLYTIDVLCHGVPSPRFWRNYLEYLANGSGTITDVRFRNKSNTNRMGYLLKYKISGKEKTIYPNESVYYQSFIDGASLRPSCYRCPFVDDYEGTDLTLADSNNKEFHPYEAISLVITRTEKGEKLVQSIRDRCETIEANIDIDRAYNKKLVTATISPKNRETFYKTGIHKMKIGISYKTFIINRIKNILPTIIKDVLRREKK